MRWRSLPLIALPQVTLLQKVASSSSAAWLTDLLVYRRVPAGKNPGQAERQDAISVLLSEFGGITDVKNMFLIGTCFVDQPILRGFLMRLEWLLACSTGCTNRKNAMDLALLRPGRLDSKIFVGVPGRSLASALALSIQLTGC